MDFSLIIPVFNEEANLPDLLADIERFAAAFPRPFELIAVDDHSLDASPRILRDAQKRLPFLRVTATERNTGMGGALLAGSAMARGKYIVWSMADLADRLDDIGPMLERLDAGANLVVASRAMQGGGYGELGRGKAFLSHAFSFTARIVFGIPIHDVTNAFRAFRSELLSKLDLRTRNFTISPEMVIKAHRAGARIAEVPTMYRYRRAGVSSFKVLRMGMEYSALLFLRILPKPRLPERNP